HVRIEPITSVSRSPLPHSIWYAGSENDTVESLFDRSSIHLIGELWILCSEERILHQVPPIHVTVAGSSDNDAFTRISCISACRRYCLDGFLLTLLLGCFLSLCSNGCLVRLAFIQVTFVIGIDLSLLPKDRIRRMPHSLEYFFSLFISRVWIDDLPVVRCEMESRIPVPKQEVEIT